MYKDVHPDLGTACDADFSRDGRGCDASLDVHTVWTFHDNQDECLTAYENYNRAIEAAQRHGPVIGCGNHNTSVGYRIDGEAWVGPHVV